MPRFLFIAAQNKPLSGGSELLWSRVASALAGQGHSVVVSVPPEGAFSGEPTPGLRICVRQSPSASLPNRLLGKLGRRFPSVEEAAFTEALREGTPDLIVINQPGFIEGVSWASEAGKRGLPYVLIVHNTHRWAWLHPKFAGEVAAIYRAAARIDLLSDQAENDLTDILGVDFRQAARFRNPYNVSFGDCPPFPPHTEGLSLAMVGRLDMRQKGYDLALRALSGPAWKTRNVTLNMYGGGEFKEFIQAMASRLGVARFNLHGHVTDIEGVWRTNHALLMPSRYEGLPIAMVEAMLSARLVIATDVGGIAGWIRHGENGFLIPAATPRSVSRSLDEAWQARHRWEEMGQVARRDALRLTSSDPVTEYAEGLLSLVVEVRR
ncbi:MAG: glycosyltransferase family 4 protein [Opitutales bacterium]|nr:glycosyltransferase family 4 protein [Opitutales bacterium]